MLKSLIFALWIFGINIAMLISIKGLNSATIIGILIYLWAAFWLWYYIERYDKNGKD